MHSHNQHLYGLLEMAKKMGVENVYVHALLDGRDVPPSSGKDFVKELMEKMKEIGVGKVATVMGRYYAMDRDNRWERVEKAYNAMVCREGEEFACPVCAVSKSYENEVTDEFVVPCVIKGGAPVASGDSVVFFNFRPDRAREITRTFVDPDFTGFTRKNGFFPLTYVCMTQYDATMPNVRLHSSRRALKTPSASTSPIRPQAAPHCRNREVCACHILLQRRRREAVSGRGPHPCQVPEGRNV